jgi:hypothetical protein
MIVGVTLAAIAFPVGAGAAPSGKEVVLVDPDTGEPASVFNGALIVGDGNGPFTVDGAVTVEGAVQPAIPEGLTTRLQGVVMGGTSFLAKGSPGERAAITSLTFMNDGITEMELRVFAAESDSLCSAVGDELGNLMNVHVPPLSQEHFAFPQPVLSPPSPPSATWCVFAQHEFGPGAGVLINYFLT